MLQLLLRQVRVLGVDVDHQFARTSVLRFQTYVYNPARNTTGVPNVWIEALVLSGKQSVLKVAPSQVPADVARDLDITVNQVYLAKSRILRKLRVEFRELIDGC